MNRRLLAYKKQEGNNFWENLNSIYTLRKVSFWSNAVLKIRRDSDNATAYVFVDGASSQDGVSTSSYISTSSNTTPSAITLSSWVSSDDAFVEEWIACTIDDVIDNDIIVSQTTTTRQPQFISSGTILTKGGKPTIDFLSGTKTLWKNLPFTSLDNTNDLTFLTVSAINVLDTFSIIFRLYHPTSNYLAICNDGRNANLNTLLITTGGTYHNNNLSQFNTTDLKLVSCIKSTTFTRTYNNDAFQQEVAQDGLSYDVARLVFGGFTDSNSYNIKISEVLIFNDKDQTKISDRHSNINSFYSIY